MDKKKKAKIDFKVLGRVLKLIIDKYKIQLIVVILAIILNSIAMSMGSLYLQTIIDDDIMPLIGVENPALTGIIHGVSVLGFIYIISVISSFISSRVMAVVSEGTMKKIRDDMFEKMQRLPIRYFDTNTYGDIMSRYTNDTDALSMMIVQGIPQLVSTIVTIVTVFASMLFTNIYLTSVVVVTMAIIFYTTKLITGNSGKYFIVQQQALGKLNGYIEEMINGQKVIKVFCHEDKTKEGFDTLNDDLASQVYNANKYVGYIGPINGALGNVQYALVAIAGGLFAVYGIGNMTIGLIVAFLQLSKAFVKPINQISRQLNAIVLALAGAKRIFNLMDQEPEKDDGYVTLVNAKYVDGKLTECEEKTELWAWKHPHKDGTLEYVEVKGHIEFIDVDFAYDKGKTILHDISLYAKPGQKIAFVGATGAGKTTITNLINRFYDIEDGKIRYDGININKIKKDDLRLSLGMVLQDTHLFTGTIKDNIKYGNDKATDQEVINAAKLANAHDFIMMLPNGYDTMLTGDGANLSQGQRQLLAIARCALVDPPVMILDEATSSIDTRTEKIVQDGMDKLMNGRTVFVIAHRLSTVRNSKAIMVLDHGKIIERGDHETLIKEKGTYYQLYTGAFELE